MSFEAAAIALGTAVVKNAVGIWLGSNKIAVDIAGQAVDVAAGRLTGLREQNRFRRASDQAAETIAERLEPLIRQEFRNIPENERIAAIDAVAETLRRVALTDVDLFAVDLNAGHLEQFVRGKSPDMSERVALSADATKLYDLVLREACSYVLQIRSALPQAGIVGLAEVLRRETQMLDLVRAALDRLPERRAGASLRSSPEHDGCLYAVKLVWGRRRFCNGSRCTAPVVPSIHPCRNGIERFRFTFPSVDTPAASCPHPSSSLPRSASISPLRCPQDGFTASSAPGRPSSLSMESTS